MEKNFSNKQDQNKRKKLQMNILIDLSINRLKYIKFLNI